MSEKKKRVLEIFEKLLPKMSDMDVEKLLAFGEGMAFKVNQQTGNSAQVEKGLDMLRADRNSA